MELVMLGNTIKKDLLAEIKEKEQREKSEGACKEVCKIEIFNPMPVEVIDATVSEKLTEIRKVETKKIKTEKAEKEKFMNAVMLTDIQATIKKAGFYPDGTPKMAIAGLLDKEVKFTARHATGDRQQAAYLSGSLNVALVDVKTDWKEAVLFFVGFIAAVASFSIGMINGVLHYTKDIAYYIEAIHLACALVPGSIFICVVCKYDDGKYLDLSMPNIGKIRPRPDFYTELPLIPESVLSKIYGIGPFAILFEVTQGWQKIEPDPVIFRVINIGDKQFFEPLVGYNMTPLEKQSLTEINS